MRTRKLRKRVTMGPRKDIIFNGAVFEALGGPAAVELLFDEVQKNIGLRPADIELPNALPVSRFGTRHSYRVSAGRFCNHFGLGIPCRILFEDVFIDTDGILVLPLKKAIVAPGAKWTDREI
jgi:hypothetical protein